MRFFVTMVIGAAMVNAAPTFYKDVVPILQKNCQSCHRAGEAAPMALITYQDARPWAASIKQALLTRKMPPWFADASYGHFSNDRTLPKADLDTIVAWVDGGAPAGNAKDAPKPIEFAEG